MVSWLEEKLPEPLVERLNRAVATLDEAERARVLCHYDADGTAAAAVLTAALLRQGLEVHTTLSHTLREETVQEVAQDAMDVLLVADMGSAQVDLLERFEVPVLVFDHHQPLRDSENVVQVNPHFFGMQGTRDACGATTSFLFAHAVDPRNLDLAGVALAGCIGDRQHVGGFAGINRLLFDRALAEGILEGQRGPALADLPLEESLFFSVGPYFRGLSGREDGVRTFLQELELDPQARFRDLPEADQERLLSVLTLRLQDQNIRPETVRQLVEAKYWYPAFEVFVDDLESWVNACSRQGRESLGLSLALGDFTRRQEAEELRRKHWRDVLRGLRKVEEEGVFAKDHVQFFYADGPTLAGSVAGVAMRYLLDQEKATVAFAVTDGVTKVSARGTDHLVARGLDLALALREGAQATGGDGGGHNIASGASIPKGKEEKFLETVNAVVARQLAS